MAELQQQPPLITRLGSRSFREREQALRELERTIERQGERAWPTVRLGLQHDDPEVRRRTITALSSAGGPVLQMLVREVGAVHRALTGSSEPERERSRRLLEAVCTLQRSERPEAAAAAGMTVRAFLQLPDSCRIVLGMLGSGRPLARAVLDSLGPMDAQLEYLATGLPRPGEAGYADRVRPVVQLAQAFIEEQQGCIAAGGSEGPLKDLILYLRAQRHPPLRRLHEAADAYLDRLRAQGGR